MEHLHVPRLPQGHDHFKVSLGLPVRVTDIGLSTSSSLSLQVVGPARHTRGMSDFFEMDGGSVMGRACPACGFDEAMVEFEPIIIMFSSDVLDFPVRDWGGWFRCSRCGAASREYGDHDRTRTLALEEALTYQRRHPSGPPLVVTMP